ncbi:MAG TPA: hypothetical protein VEX60_05035 [Pyrinomonadaceae bacterium]|nr:hypothetical protein [Pyrinomonadaceae bacterium]
MQRTLFDGPGAFVRRLAATFICGLTLAAVPAFAQTGAPTKESPQKTRLLILAYLPDADPTLRSLAGDTTFKSFVKRVEKSPQVILTAGEEPSRQQAASKRNAFDHVEIVDRVRAVERAKAQKETYVVLLHSGDQGGRGPSRVNADVQRLDYIILAPGTADIVAQGTVEETAPNQSTLGASSGTNKPRSPGAAPVSPTPPRGPMTERILGSTNTSTQPYTFEVQRRVGREAADRVLAALGLSKS